MPYIRQDPEVFLEYNGVTVFQTYRNGDMNEQNDTCFSICACGDDEFDVTELTVYEDGMDNADVIKKAIDNGELTCGDERVCTLNTEQEDQNENEINILISYPESDLLPDCFRFKLNGGTTKESFISCVRDAIQELAQDEEADRLSRLDAVIAYVIENTGCSCECLVADYEFEIL